MRIAFASLLAAGSVVALAAPVAAQSIKPRFVIILDTSGSMSMNAAGRETHGDGTVRQEGCDLDNNGLYDDSRIAQAKGALNDTIAAFPSAEFALARYHATDLSQTCTGNGQGTCPNNWSCIDPSHVPGTQKYCAINDRQGCSNNDTCFDECTGGTANGNGCIRCKSEPNTGDILVDPWDIYTRGISCGTCVWPNCQGADVVVPFPGGTSNYSQLLTWLDGVDSYPASTANPELRPHNNTPIAGSLGSVNEWLSKAGSAVGSGSNPLGTDAKVACRSYNVILLTDGDESCNGTPKDAAEQLYNQCTNGGFWDVVDKRCEIANSPAGTALSGKHVKTYAIGFATGLGNLNPIAVAGGTTAAVGATNRAELTARLGDIIAASIPVPKCDCDATCDDEASAFPLKGQPCSVGVGRCKRKGVWACNGAGNGVICSSTPAGTCPGTQLNAGTGVTEQCGAAAGCDPSLTPDECADDNCDGQVDEGLSCSCLGKPELCNGADDNCNGTPDENIPSVKCGLAIGECKQGDTACQNGSTVCLNATSPTAEICDNKDNDCDGITDQFGESCYPVGFTGCTYNPGTKTWSCAGACQTGTHVCVAASFSACSGAIAPSTELACDGIDNDCDGQTDEGFNLGQPCGPGVSNVGECRAGRYECQGGAVTCVGGIGPQAETCNGKDDDCDGNLDGPLGPCGLTIGECRAGTYRCNGAQQVCDQPQGPTAETCNGKDDDCDGAIDNNLTDADLVVATACSSNVGVCKPGVLRCISGRKVCDGGVTPQVEVCNNIDDDCDGCVDCDPTCLAGLGKTCPIPGAGQACGSNVGECKAGQLLCIAGAIQCLGAKNPGDELCDGLDNDCNGFTDETDPQQGNKCWPDGAVGCNVATDTCVGDCQFGTKLCGNGTFSCANPVLPSAESCDGKDNDCDGQTDETFDVGTACDNGGSGTCLKAGTRICNARGDGTTCSVPPLVVGQEVCDGEDNDCDGKVDSDDTDAPLPGVGVACGSNVGECRQGSTTCVAGKLACGEVGPKPEICDGKDNDCDGTVDDNVMPPADECPPAGLPPGSAVVGECKPGKFLCARGDDGTWGWQCRGAVGPTTEICDGKDNDCDGRGDAEQLCPGTSICMAGECTPKCNDSEFPCPADRTCKNGLCVRNPCVTITCPTGQYCDGEGKCIDPCADKTCLSGQTCERGVCVDCFVRGCPAGKVCQNRECVPDKCADVTCEGNAFCRDGACVKSCQDVVCGAGQRCADGVCKVDPCVGVSCPTGDFCDPTLGACKPRACAVVQCMPGNKCIETTGKCVTDPCLEVRCQAGDLCVVAVDGTAGCFRDPSLPPPVERRVATSGGGLSQCACHLGAPETPGTRGFAGAWMVALAGLFLVARRRRR